MAIAPPSGIYGVAPRRPAARVLGRAGIWSSELRVGDVRALADQVAELESLGYGAVWMPGREGDVFDVARAYLQATDRLAVATGIVSIWRYDAGSVAKAAVALDDASGGRFVLGLGVSHGPLVNTDAAAPYRHPLAHMHEYLDQLEERLAVAGGPETRPTVPSLVAALGPRMMDLAGRRTTGTHPYLVPPAHTAAARQRLGAAPVVAPCQTVTLARGDDARRLLREELDLYLRLPNYVDNWRRFGVTDDDLSGGGSDRLLELLFAWGGEDAVADRVREHREAGADHVCVKVLTDAGSGSGAAPAGKTPLEEWRRLAPALTA